MPGGSEYPGPVEALERYSAVVETAKADSKVKGAKNPYTSCNGHMFSFLTPEGVMAIRLSDEEGAEFKSQYESGEVKQYGAVMRGYVSVPDDLLADTGSMADWFDRSHDWIGTLPPKPTKK